MIGPAGFMAAPKAERATDAQRHVERLVGQRCILLDPRCRGQVCTAERVAREGMKMTGVGIVPHDEYRLATPEECAAWDNR